MSYDCVCDYDPPEFYEARIQKARKQYKCEECTGTIEPGEPYEYVAGRWDGYFDTFKTCQRCVDLRTWVKNNIPCTCWAHGNLREDLRESVEHAAFRAADETAGIRFGFLRRLVAIDKFNAARRSALTFNDGKKA
jgi:hypothetical protein